METSSLIEQDPDSFHMLSKEQRRNEAKKIYQLLKKTQKKTQPKEYDKPNNPAKLQDQLIKEQMSDSQSKEHLCSRVCLMVLEGLQNGIKLRLLRKDNPTLKALSEIKLKNTPIVALKKLSKMFIELLPKNIINLSQKEFYEKFLFNGRMLVFFKKHDLSLIRTFRNLFQIKDWLRENKEYLNHGYLRDYVPDEIMEKLTELSETYKHMNLIYDTFESQIKRQKRNRTPKTQTPLPTIYHTTNQSIKDKISIQELLMDQIKKEQQEQQQE